MRFWKWVSESPATKFFSLLLVLTAVSGSTQATAASGESGPWIWQPWVSVAGGHESDIVLDPEFTRTLVPGGAFVDLSPGFRLSKRLSTKTTFRLLNRTSLEQFFNDENRTLFATSLFGDFRFGGRSPFRARVTLSGDYFDDSGSDTFRRSSGGVEVGAGADYARWRFELSAYAQGRRYPNIMVTSLPDSGGTYTEDHRGLSAYLVWNPVGDLVVRGQISGRDTNAADMLFDSRSATFSGNVDYIFPGGFWISANLTHQARTFDNRTADQDSDSYDQFGLGIGRAISRRLEATARYARANYNYPLGGEESTDRFSVAVTWQFGKDSPMVPRPNVPRGDVGLRPRIAGEPTVFQIQAPGASRVSLVGTFNGWEPAAHPLRKTGQDRWEVRLSLPAGTYEYLYLVDGKPMLPDDVTTTVDDGFGGRNGFLLIVAEDR